MESRKQRIITLGLAKTLFLQKPCEFQISLPRSLLKTIKSSLQFANLSWFSFGISRMRLYKNFFINITMQKSIINIQLVQQPMFGSSKAMNSLTAVSLATGENVCL